MFERTLKTVKNDIEIGRISSICLQERLSWIEEKGPVSGPIFSL